MARTKTMMFCSKCFKPFIMNENQMEPEQTYPKYQKSELVCDSCRAKVEVSSKSEKLK